MPWQLLVIDGADQGRYFPLPQTGTVVIGHSHKHCDIFLNDLYVSRIHCHIETDGDLVRVIEADPPGGTSVNGQVVSSQILQPNDVLRVGNSHLRLEAYVGQPPAKTAKPTSGPAPAPQLPPERLSELAGHKLGHFELGEPLGTGFSGVTFSAYDHKEQKPVALKVLAPDFPKDNLELQRFAQVMKTALALRHANLVTIYGVGKSGPYVWIAQELIDGESVSEALERIAAGSKPKWPRALRLGIHLARALQHLHRHKILHGFLTPNNIMVRTEDNVAKINDVLLSKALERTALQQRIREKKLLAEMAYLAPEQLHSGGYVDATADLYSLGAIIYARLTGRPPFKGATPEELLSRIEEGVFVKPMKFQPNMPPALEKLVIKLLSQDPANRLQTPMELVALLERLAEETGVRV